MNHDRITGWIRDKRLENGSVFEAHRSIFVIGCQSAVEAVRIMGDYKPQQLVIFLTGALQMGANEITAGIWARGIGDLRSSRSGHRCGDHQQ